MDGPARADFLRVYGPGVALLVVAYVLFTAVRDLRDNFAAEIWTALGFGETAAIFTAVPVLSMISPPRVDSAPTAADPPGSVSVTGRASAIASFGRSLLRMVPTPSASPSAAPTGAGWT
jgi:hypothetical protein